MCSGTVFGKKYRIERQIGSGSFGDVYLANNVITLELVAIKLESTKAKHPQLKNEERLYQTLAGGVGIPSIRWFGTELGYNIMVLDLLGYNLEDLFSHCGHKFSLKTVLLLADQLIARIEYIHGMSIVHGDVKPRNVLMGINEDAHMANIIDFGLSKKFRDRTNAHVPYSTGYKRTGAFRYMSINTHLGVRQSRRDDMVALGYVLAYLLRGRLPWQGLGGNTTEEQNRRIMEKKKATSVEALFDGCPGEFVDYLNHALSLEFEAEPNYAYLRGIFQGLLHRKGFQCDYVFDWTI